MQSNTTVSLETDIGEVLGLEALSEEERTELFARLANGVMLSTITRLVQQLTDEQASALEYYLESESDQQVVMQHMQATYPSFNEIFLEEVLEMKQSIVTMLGEQSDK